MKVIMLMVETLNGKITKGDDDKLRWGGRADKLFFKDRSQEIGTVIMGSSTFDAQRHRPLPNRHNIVMTRSPEKYSAIKADNLEFTAESPEQLLTRLAKTLKSVALVGGGTLNAQFLNKGLIDEMYVTIAPRIFHGAQEIFAGLDEVTTKLELLDIIKLDNDTVCLHYAVKRSA